MVAGIFIDTNFKLKTFFNSSVKVHVKLAAVPFGLSISNLFAVVYNVPEDVSTIQSAIDMSSNGDTVLVHPGIYEENINFEGKAITVASLFLTTGDENYIDQTIIDADGNGIDAIAISASGGGDIANASALVVDAIPGD